MRIAVVACMLCFWLPSVALSASPGWLIEQESQQPSAPDASSDIDEPTQVWREVKAQYRQSLQRYQQQLRSEWPDADVGDQHRWVTYSTDLKSRRAVDFRHNRIEITVENTAAQGLDFNALHRLVTAQLEQVVSTTVISAFSQDPLLQAMQSVFEQHTTTTGELPEKLVLAELFATPDPAQADIRRVAAELMQRASIRYQAVTASVASVPVNAQRRVTYLIPLPDDRIQRKVREYAPVVRQQAERFRLSDDIVMAIIHTESSFNPLARSHIPAFGLMQIVPATAGRDATRLVYNEARVLSARYLYDPERNILIGSAYLHMLYYQYLAGIEHPESRLYYTVAAYNGGMTSVARAFGGRANYREAEARINAMNPDAVLQALVTRAPSRETREYLQKVLQRKAIYQRL